jgi:hypothetical protein
MFKPMLKRASLSATIAVATLVALPAASQARDCLGLDRVGTGVVRVVDGVGHAVTRVGDGLVRTGDRMLGWLRCDRPLK